MRLTAAVALGLFASAGLASAANARTRIAIPDFQIEGGSSPALGIQLQDGFVLGLVRGGVQVLDPIPPGLDKDVFFKRLQDALETATARLIAEAKAAGR